MTMEWQSSFFFRGNGKKYRKPGDSGSKTLNTDLQFGISEEPKLKKNYLRGTIRVLDKRYE